jgi:ABC-type sugar transport system ATPase subunit
MANVRLEQVSRCFESGHAALSSVTFDVQDRQTVTVVGPSGCGKSTLLRVIAGLDSPTSGEVFIDGKPMAGIEPKDRDIAMVFQSYALYPHMTCRENLALSLTLRKMSAPDIEKRIKETAELLELGGLLEKRPRELSGGQRQRVAVGRALIRRPKVFLFDEPLSNLDALLREKVRHELKQLFTRVDATVIYVTHDQTEAMSLADRIVVLNQGQVQQIGTPHDVHRSPFNRFVASFIGSPSMNFFEVTLQDGAFQLGGDSFTTTTRDSGVAVVGIRPEALHVVEGRAGRVLWKEYLGSQILGGIRFGDITLTALATQLPASENVAVVVAPEDIYLFDIKTGQTVNCGPSRGTACA